MTNQKTAVYDAIVDLLANHGVEFSDGDNIAAFMTKERRAIVSAILVDGFKNGDIELKVEMSDTDLRTYVSGLISNWVKKDKRFNGGVKHTAKNPGSRAGSGDARLVNAKRLLAQLEGEGKKDTDDHAMVVTYITDLTAEITAAKAKTIAVDFNALPEALRKFAKA